MQLTLIFESCIQHPQLDEFGVTPLIGRLAAQYVSTRTLPAIIQSLLLTNDRSIATDTYTSSIRQNRN